MKWLGSTALALLALFYEAPARADDLRTNSIAITSFCFALGTVPGAIYYGFDQPASRPLWVLHAGIAPSIPRATMRDWLGTALFASVRTGSIILAERWRNVETSHGTRAGGEFFVFGYVLPLVTGIIDIATTPRREVPKAVAARPQVALDLRRDGFLIGLTLVD